MFSRCLAWIPDYPAAVLAGVLALTLSALLALFDPVAMQPKFDVDPSMSALLPRAGEALEVFERARRHFKDDDVLLVAWIDDDLFSPARLAALKRFTRRVERLPGVARVDSLATALDMRPEPAQTVVAPFLRRIPSDAAASDRARTRATSNPMFAGRLVSEDGRGTLVTIRFEPDLATRTLIERVAEIGTASREEADGTEQFLSGPLLVRLEISRILLRDLYRVMPLAVFATLLVAALAFRSVRGIVLPVAANGVAVVAVLAVFVAAGNELNFVTVILPPVVYVVGYAYSIHVICAFDRMFVPGADRRQAVKAAVADVLAPLALTAATTALAFAALGLSNIDSIRTFGLYAALGTVLAWLGALVVVPAGLALLPARPHPLLEQRVVVRVAARLARFDCDHRGIVLGAGAAVMAGAALAATQIAVDTEVLRNFDRESAVQRHFEQIASVFSGPVPLRIVIEADRPDAFREPAALRELAALAQWLKAQPEIGGVYTLADYVGLLHHAIEPASAAADPIPGTRRLVDHFLLLGGGEDLRHFVDPSFSSALVHVGTAALSTAAVNGLADRIQARLTALPAGLRGQLTGTSYLISRTVDEITVGQVTSLALALGVILIVLSLGFGSLRVGMLALLPNALPVVFYFGLLGLSPMTLNLTTSLVACAVFGIAIDDTVHFLTRFGIESAHGGGGEGAVAATLAAVLKPVTVTTAALAAGFLALTAGELKSQAEFGLLAAATLAFACVVDLTFTPALCRSVRIVPVWHGFGTNRQAPPARKP